MIGRREIEGFEALTLSSDSAGGVEVAFVPEAGMVAPSLRHRSEELLGLRDGLANYVEQRSTMGIPLLHPWANRLAETRFRLGETEVDLGLAEPPPSTDPQGLPIHGLLSAAPGWNVTRHEPADDGGVLAAEFDFAGSGLIRAFPFPHRLRIEATLTGSRLDLATTIAPTGDVAVPVAFGYHPYLTLPGLAREEWLIEVPAHERLRLDSRMIPTGDIEPVTVADGPLGGRTFDDAYLSPPDSAPFALAGGGRRIEIRFDRSFPYAQVYAPDDDAVIAFEPMTAPANALVTGGDALRWVDPGADHTAGFSIEVSEQ
jgi:galactose mutarotase-like enzyme